MIDSLIGATLWVSALGAMWLWGYGCGWSNGWDEASRAYDGLEKSVQRLQAKVCDMWPREGKADA